MTSLDATIADQANSFDLLRIIAGEANLSTADRSALRTAADELEAAQRTLCLVHLNLIETQQRLIATNDRLLQLYRQATPHPRWSMSAGWMQMVPRC